MIWNDIVGVRFYRPHSHALNRSTPLHYNVNVNLQLYSNSNLVID